MTYQTFRFLAYTFDSDKKTLRLRYGYDDALAFSETYHFDFPFVEYDTAVLESALQHLFFIAGVSYYKAYVAPEIRIETGSIDQNLSAFLSETYEKGLGEFWYVNGLDPHTTVTFPVTTDAPSPTEEWHPDGLLIGIGGGKDSLLTTGLLRNTELDIATWSLNHRPQLTPLVERIGLPHYWVEREWDPQVQVLNNQGAYNGHIPISAIFAAVGTIVAILTGRRDNVVSNEQSANEPTLEYQGTAINHQYSKSQAFERGYQALLQHRFGDSQRYYSALRPFSELRIAELFASKGFEKYHDVFSSCNTAFRHGSNHLFWDGTCPKCAFVFLALTPFVPRHAIEELFGGKNLLLDSSLTQTYKQLLGIEGDKPLDCVGEVRESRAAMLLAQESYPELAHYLFDVPEEYDFRKLWHSEMPKEIWEVILPQIA